MDRLFGFDKPSDQKGLALVATIYNPAELAVIKTVLDDAEIPFLAKDRGSGGMVKVVMGFSVYGTDIFVREQDAEVAMALLSPAEDDGEEGDNND
jgi:hypothetical protein